jgi:hypothetical protein
MTPDETDGRLVDIDRAAGCGLPPNSVRHANPAAYTCAHVDSAIRAVGHAGFGYANA